MNKVELIGRLTADPELRYSQNNKAYTKFTLAVNRSFKKETGEKDADFISIVAWEKNAERICNYLRKGNQIGLIGRIQTGIYDKEDGSRKYLTDVILSEVDFLESKSKNRNDEPTVDPIEDDPFSDFGDSIQVTDDELPF